MSKRRHHYVPRLYLKNFASEEGRVNIVNMRNLNAYRNGPLKDQCSRNHLYGATDELENWLSRMENDFPKPIQTIITQSRLPASGSSDRKMLLWFLAIQMVRTVAAAERITHTFQQVRELFQREYGGYSSNIEHLLSGTTQEAAQIALANTPKLFHCLEDLGIHLVVNRGSTRFMTSDNPTFKYNLFCEEVKGAGVLGAAKTGFMLFTPFSPEHLVILYDKQIYKVGSRDSDVTEVGDPDDIQTINMFQAINADSSLLFSRWEDKDRIIEAARKAKRYRPKFRTEVVELVPHDNRKGNSIIQTFDKMPNLRLRLSFLSILREARRMSFEERVNGMRLVAGFQRQKPKPHDGPFTRYVVKKPKRKPR